MAEGAGCTRTGLGTGVSRAGSGGASPSIAVVPAEAVRARICFSVALSITTRARSTRGARSVSGDGPPNGPSLTISAVGARPRAGRGSVISASIACTVATVAGVVSCPLGPRTRIESRASCITRFVGRATLPSPRCGSPFLLGPSLAVRLPISGARVVFLGRRQGRRGSTVPGTAPATCRVIASCRSSASALRPATPAMASSDPTSRSTRVIKVL